MVNPILPSKQSGSSFKKLEHITSMLLLPLLVWFAFHLQVLLTLDYASLQTWLELPWHTVASIALFIIGLLHFTLKLQVVFEDYMPPAKRSFFITLTRLVSIILGSLAIIAILKGFLA